MKIFKINKNQLKWKEIGQIKYKWILPVLVNHKREVILGNSLFDSLPSEIFICVIEKNQKLEDNLFYIESKVVEEDSEKRIGIIDFELREYFRELRKPEVEQMELFNEYKTSECISEENYRRPDETITYAHGIKNESEDYQLYLFEDEKEIVEKIKDEYSDIIIDLEIMKELL